MSTDGSTLGRNDKGSIAEDLIEVGVDQAVSVSSFAKLKLSD